MNTHASMIFIFSVMPEKEVRHYDNGSFTLNNKKVKILPESYNMYQHFSYSQRVGYGAQGELHLSNSNTIHWPNNKGPPANRPPCGFSGDAPECINIQGTL
jgi:hypothetical protein